MKIGEYGSGQAWNAGDDGARRVNHQDRYDRMNAPFAGLIPD